MSISDAMTATLLEYELHIDMMRTRLLQAREAAQRAIRFGLKPNSSDDKQCEDIVCVFARDMDRVIEILENKQ